LRYKLYFPPEVRVSKRYWLMKSEPETYSIDDLKREKSTLWTGVRNYQARNFMLNDMQPGDVVLFYHSNAEPPAVVGLAEVSGPAVPDPTALDPKSEYHDPKASPEKPIWFCVQVRYKKSLPAPLTLSRLKEAKGLEKMALLQKGSRLSVQPVTEREFEIIKQLIRNK
jgi:predicted RNA-binding protein with PUA-like domain